MSFAFLSLTLVLVGPNPGLGHRSLMYRVLPHFRSPDTIAAIDSFLCHHPQKTEVLSMLANGLRGHWAPQLPRPNHTASNYLGSAAARRQCRLRFKKEVTAGRMIGGPG